MEEIKKVTDNFSDKNKMAGGQGEVFKGKRKEREKRKEKRKFFRSFHLYF